MILTKKLRSALCIGMGIAFALLTSGASHSAPILLVFDPASQTVKPGQTFHLQVFASGADTLPFGLRSYRVGISWNRTIAGLVSATGGDFGGNGGTPLVLEESCPNCFSGFVHFTQGTQAPDPVVEPASFLLFDMLFSATPSFSGETSFRFGDVTLIDTARDVVPVNASNTASVAVVPEPSTLALLGIGFAGLVSTRRRRESALSAA